MRETRINTGLRRLHYAAATIACGLGITAQAAAPGITGPTFNLQAAPGYISQPDGTSVYTWGYGCNGTPVRLLARRRSAGVLPNVDATAGADADRHRRTDGERHADATTFRKQPATRRSCSPALTM